MTRPIHALARFASATLLLLVAAACSDAPRSIAVPPGPRAAALAPGSACQAADLTALADRIATDVAKSAQSSANGLLRDVTAACRRNATTPGTAAALTYTAQLLAWWRPTAPAPKLWAGTDAALWSYLTTLFRAVGYTIDSDATALGDESFIGVCTASAGCTLIAKERTSGIKIFPGALSATGSDKFLVTGRPVVCTDLDAKTDVRVWGQCIDVSVDPKAGKSFALQKVSPVPALVQTCLTNTAYQAAKYYLADADGHPIDVVLPDATTSRLRLAQRSGGKTTVSLRPRPQSNAASFYDSDQFFEADCDAAEYPPFPTTTGATSSALRWFGRARSFATGLLTATPLYAAHGGLGSLGVIEEMSVFGPVDPFVFEATFDNPYGVAATAHVTDTPGVQPVNDDIGRASWNIDFQPPGYVRVRAVPFGGFTTGTNVVEVNQAGGASDGKKGLTMLAALARFESADTTKGQPADTGKYRIRWTSSVASPRAGGAGAPFVAVRVANGDTLELARFAYVNGPNAQSGTVRFGTQTLPGVTWRQSVPARYEILVDLGAGKSYLRSVDASLPTGGAYLKDASGAYLSQTFGAGKSLTHVGWRLGLRDNQVLAMDDFEVVRLADTFPPPPPLP